MNQAVMEKYRDLFRKDLFEKVLPFWVDHGLDKEHGGIDTCLDLSGKVYSAEKSVWMQGRGGWLFSYVCNMFGIDESYRQMAQSLSLIHILLDRIDPVEALKSIE